MADDYLPGAPHFWVYWVVSICLIVVVVLASILLLVIKYRKALKVFVEQQRKDQRLDLKGASTIDIPTKTALIARTSSMTISKLK
jgi:heme exporter protein D